MNKKIILVVFAVFLLISLANARDLQNEENVFLKITDEGSEFSLAQKDKVVFRPYFKDESETIKFLQSDNSLNYSNEFIKIDNKRVKWNIHFDKTSQPELDEIYFQISNSRMIGNLIVTNDYLIDFEDAIEEGYNVNMEQTLENMVTVKISGFGGAKGIIIIDPNIVDRQNEFTLDASINVRDISGLLGADIDSDGDVDIIAVDRTGSDNKIIIFCNDGLGDFSNDLNLSGDYFQRFSVEDFNGDSWRDLVIQDGSGTEIITYLNSGTGTCSTTYNNDVNVITPDASLGANGRDFSVADYDNDGLYDIVGGPNSSWRFYHGDGNGTFTLNQTISVGNFAGNYICSEDFSGDGFLDILLPGISAAKTKYQTNSGPGNISFDANTSYDFLATTCWAADVDFDGLPDGFFMGTSSTFKLNTLLNQGGIPIIADFNSGSESGAQFDNAQRKTGVMDFDADGNFDNIAVDGLAVVWYGRGNGIFNTDANIVLESGSGASEVFTADLNNDGFLDFFLKRGGAEIIDIYDNNASLQGATNAVPSAPTTGFSTSCSEGILSVAWGQGSDTETPANGLSYNIRVGTSSDSNNLYVPKNSFPFRGNMASRRSTDLNFAGRGFTCNDNFYWAVQAIDSTLLRSPFSAEQALALDVNFLATPGSPQYLDPENNLNSVTVDFNNTTDSTGFTVSDYNWFIEGIAKSTDQNFVGNVFAAPGDFNVSLIVTTTTGRQSQKDLNFLVRNLPQGIDINFLFDTNSLGIDVNFGVGIADGNAISFVWGFPNDKNLSGAIARQFYDTGDTREVCVVVTAEIDVNKVACETFFSTHVIGKVPLAENNLLVLSPFSMSLNTNPVQAFSAVSEDQNFWFFNDSAGFGDFTLFVDFNLSYFTRSYLIQTSATDLNQIIQPYLTLVATGIEVTITGKDSLTDKVVPDVALFFSRQITGVGNVLVQSGITDTLGRVTFSFEPNVDHNFSVFFPSTSFLFSGRYLPITADATNGLEVAVPVSPISVDQNIIGVVDVNFLQTTIVTVKSDSTVDLNQIAISTRDLSTIAITVDHNGVNLFSDTNSIGVTTGGIFSQIIDVTGLDKRIPLIVTYDFTFVDGNTGTIAKAIQIEGGAALENPLINVRDNELGLGGSMILLAFLLSILLGVIHFNVPNIDNSHTFVIAAIILLFFSLFGWVDGVSWIFATIAGGAAYVLRRVPS